MKVTIVMAAAMAIAGGMLASEAQAGRKDDRAAFEEVFGRCGDPCTVKANPGGDVEKFTQAAAAVGRGAKRLVRIDGPCASACVIFADIARDKVCITPRAQFGFHKAKLMMVSSFAGARVGVVLARSDPKHSRDIASWVRKRGGFPDDGLRVMDNREARRFWKRCR